MAITRSHSKLLLYAALLLVVTATSTFVLLGHLERTDTVASIHFAPTNATTESKPDAESKSAPFQSRRLLERVPRPPDPPSARAPPALHGRAASGPSALVRTLRRSRERVQDSDVPFLLETPHAGSEAIYSVLTSCYGLRGKRYLETSQLERDKESAAVDRYYVSSHERPPEGVDEYFHFVSTPHYQEGAALFTLRHRGRVVIMMRHPCVVAESMYLTRPGTVKGDVQGLLNHTMSPDYLDNWMTRMISNVPHPRPLTEKDFVEARKILENKFLVGMTSDMAETVVKRIKLYFGWKELPNRRGCEARLIDEATAGLSESGLADGSHEWREIRKRNHYDMKLYARAMTMFGRQKMGMPVHVLVSEEEKRAARGVVEGLRDVAEPAESTDVPFFWHIPKASGTTVKDTLSDCYNLVRTEMIRPPSSLDVFRGRHIINVDLSTPDSVVAAKEMGLADMGLADVFISQLVEAGTVFTPEHRGRAFTILRHPVKLAASLFYYRRIATWEPTYRPEYNDITLQEYVSMDGYYDNWMVRMLANAKLGSLNKDHLELAKSILKEKFVIGMAEHMDETFRQLEAYFGWKEKTEGCVREHLHAPSNKNKYPELERGGPVWDTIADRNKFDMSLYYYALEQFGIQSDQVFKEGEGAEVQ